MGLNQDNMAKMLCYEMSLPEKIAIGNMTLSPGFDVLKKLMADACTKATEEVIRLDPIADGYDRKLAVLTLTARATNDFCSSLLKSIETHTVAAQNETQQQNLEDERKLAAAR